MVITEGVVVITVGVVVITEGVVVITVGVVVITEGVVVIAIIIVIVPGRTNTFTILAALSVITADTQPCRSNVSTTFSYSS